MAGWRGTRRSVRRRTSGAWRHRPAAGLLLVVALTLGAVVVPVPPVRAVGGARAQTACGSAEATTGVTGEVADPVSSVAVGGALVAALRPTDHALVGGAFADADGRFTIAVAAGSYELYVVSPGADHASRMQPGLVTVTVGHLTSVTPTLVPTRGAIRGEVTDADTGDPVSGAWVIAVDPERGPVRAATVDGAGGFRLDGLPSGEHLVVYVDPSGRHEPEFSGDSRTPEGAVPVTVTPGADQVASATVAARAVPAATATLDGTVAEPGGRALAGMLVVALRSSDLSLRAGAPTDGDGAYRLDLPAGAYKLGVIDPAGAHPMVWYDDEPYTGLGTAASVVAPGTADVVVPAATGAVTGVVTDDPTGAPLGCTWVVAIGPSGSVVGVAATGVDGHYRIDGLLPGVHRLTMVDPTGARPQEYWPDSAVFSGAAEVVVRAGEEAIADGDLSSSTPFGAPTQWIARQFTELLGRPPTPAEWRTWSDHYGAQPACTAAALSLLPLYLTGLATPTVPGVAPGVATEFTTLYPDATSLDRALRAAAVVRAAYGHDPNQNDWNSRIKPYALGTTTWSATVNGLYGFIMAFVGPATFCRLDDPAYPFGFSRPLDLRSSVTTALPSEALTPSRSQSELEAALAAAAGRTTPAARTVALHPGEVVRVGGAANGNRPLAIPAGVTLTTAGAPSYVEPPDGLPRGLAYARMGRIVPATGDGPPGLSPVDGLVCEEGRCHDLGLVSLSSGARLSSVWVDGMGLSDENHGVDLVRTRGSTLEAATTVVASRVSEPSRDGAGVRLDGASTGHPCLGEQVLGNLVTGYASRHQFDQRGQAEWVDGIVVSCEDATVVANGVVDVTDVGIVVQGVVDRAGVVTRQRSQVRANTVLSAGLDAHVALGADAVGTCLPVPVADAAGVPLPTAAVPCLDLAAPRDFTGARLTANRLVTGTRTSFDVGILVGGGAVWGDHRVSTVARDAGHPDAEGVAVTANTTGGSAARVNVGVDVHDMRHATVTGNTTRFRLVDGNPRLTWGHCPEVEVLAGPEERSTLTTDLAVVVGDGTRGCVIGAPPPEGLERVELAPDGSGLVGAETRSPLHVWGGDLDVDQDLDAWVDDFRDVRRTGLNVIRLLLDTEELVDAPACPTCEPTPNAAAVDHLGDIALAAEEAGLYLDITGNGIARAHHNGSWFDDLDASPAAEALRWRAQEVFWEAVAAELEPRSSVAWYDLINEPTLGVPATTWCFTPDMPADEPCWNPNLVKTLTDPANPARERSRLEVARAWTTRMRDAIKVRAGDTTHPVSVGQLSFCAGPLNQASRELVDFDMVHMYPEDATLAADIATVNGCRVPGRPLIVEETYLTASYESLARFFEQTEDQTAGYLGHVLGGTPVEVLDWLDQHDPADDVGAYWAHVFWYVWDQFALRMVTERNPTGPGIRPR